MDTNNKSHRVIGKFEGNHRGPLLIIIGGLHGNEPAGVSAIELTFKMLQVEPITNPSFNFYGRTLGIMGNIHALEKGVRFIDEDLNRMWSSSSVEEIIAQSASERNSESYELLEILNYIKSAAAHYLPEELIILDLHTTSSEGGIFAIPTYSLRSKQIAEKLLAPVITKMLDGIHGTVMHYFDEKVTGVPTEVVTFEAGQHEDPLSVNRAIAAIINCMRSIGQVRGEDVENIHDKILSQYSERLPRISSLLYKHEIADDDGFTMNPGFKNFDSVEQGQLLGQDKNGEILAPSSGRLLMPLYQQQGSEGFFIVEVLE